MALAEPGGSIRLFADGGAALVPLLADLAAGQRAGHLIPPSPHYVRSVLEAAGGASAGAAVAAPSSTARSRGAYQPLSARELEVLRLMATGAPNERIAADLVIGVTTVKSHVNSIFRKLGAANRPRGGGAGSGRGTARSGPALRALKSGRCSRCEPPSAGLSMDVNPLEEIQKADDPTN
jgi:LuxR family maltose regulon positive regulatory protein